MRFLSEAGRGRAGLAGAAAAAMAMTVMAAIAQAQVGPAVPEEVLSPVKPYQAPAHDAATKEALARFNQDRFALFVHWGIYAQAAGVIRGKRWYGASEWLMHNSRTPSAEYLALAQDFNPVDFDARRWIRTVKAAGIRYIVITAKHHDGFAMFGSKVSPHNIVDGTPFKRDPLKELAAAAQAEGIGLGFYYSQYQDWTEPNGAGNDWEFDPKKVDFAEYFNRKVIPQVTELLTNYGPVREIWFDTPGTMPAEFSKRLRDLVKRLQPGCLLNSRIGNSLGDYASPTDSEVTPARLANGDWEAIFTHNRSWGFSSIDNDYNRDSPEGQPAAGPSSKPEPSIVCPLSRPIGHSFAIMPFMTARRPPAGVESRQKPTPLDEPVRPMPQIDRPGQSIRPDRRHRQPITDTQSTCIPQVACRLR